MNDNDHATAEGEASQDEFLESARRLMEIGCEFAAFRPTQEMSAKTRGLPAVMRELMLADGPLSPGELARRTGVTDARVANALRVLEERGFIERRPSAADRRRVEVFATELGRRDTERHAREAERFVAGFLRELGEDDTHDLLRVFGHVLDVLRRRKSEGRQVTPRPSETFKHPASDGAVSASGVGGAAPSGDVPAPAGAGPAPTVPVSKNTAPAATRKDRA